MGSLRLVLPVWICSLIGLSAMIGGCSNPSADRERPRPTPAEAVTYFLEGSARGDASVLDVIRGDDDTIAALRATIDFVQAGLSFRQAFIAAYGQDAWVQFQDPNHKPGDANAQLQLGDADNPHTLAVHENDGTAIVEVRDRFTETRVTLVEVSNGWLIEGRSMLPSGTDPAKMTATMKNLTALVQKYQKAIGRPEVTPDDIDVELGRAFMREMGIRSDAPRRFDIDAMR